jgi:8-oxo-dGTP diphosphatase
MKNESKIVVAVKGVIMNNGKALLVKRSTSDEVGGGTWECAGGKIDFGETLEEALIREIKEEVGLDVIVKNIAFATSFNTDASRQVVILTYLCESNEIEVKLSNEHSEYKWCTRDELRLLLEPNILSDFKQYSVLELID